MICNEYVMANETIEEYLTCLEGELKQWDTVVDDVDNNRSVVVGSCSISVILLCRQDVNFDDLDMVDQCALFVVSHPSILFDG